MIGGGGGALPPVPPPPQPPPPLNGLPSWLASKAINEWVAVPNSTLQNSPAWVPITPTGFGTQTAWVNAEGGLGLNETDSTVYLFNGGHSDYSGNEMASLTIASETPGWVLRAARSADVDITPYGSATSPPFYADGKPASRHSYQGTHFLRKLNRYWAAGGFTWPNAGGCGEPVTFNMDSGTWEPQGTWPIGPSANGIYAKHPITEDIYYAVGGGTSIHKLDTTTKVWTQIRAVGGTNYIPGFECGTIDTARNALVVLSTRAGTGLSQFHCYSFDITSGALTQISFNSSAALTAFQSLNTNHGGLHYSAEDDCYYYCFGGTGQGGAVWKVTPNASTTWDIEQLTMTGLAVPAGIGVANGNILTRFRYIPALRSVIALPSATAPMYIARVA